MIWYYGNERPADVVKKLRYGQRQYTVNFNVEALKEEPYAYRWQSVTLEPGIWTRGAIISAIVRLRYTDDAMQSVVNNYLDEPRTKEAEADMEEMQNWRKLAKEVATQRFTEDDDLPVTRDEVTTTQAREEDTVDELGKVVQTEQGSGSPWEAIADGVPDSETDSNYFDVVGL